MLLVPGSIKVRGTETLFPRLQPQPNLVFNSINHSLFFPTSILKYYNIPVPPDSVNDSYPNPHQDFPHLLRPIQKLRMLQKMSFRFCTHYSRETQPSICFCPYLPRNMTVKKQMYNSLLFL